MTQKILNRYNFFLNSKNATEKVFGTAQVMYELTQKISLSDPHAYFEVTINRANIPYSFHQFCAERNNITLQYDIFPVITSSATILSGNYTIVQLLDAFKLLVEQEVLNHTGINVDVTCEYNIINNRVRIKMTSSGAPVQMVIGLNGLTKALGFTSIFGLDTTTGAWAYAQTDVNTNPICCLYVVSNELTQNTTFDALGTPLQSANIIGVIPLVHSPLYWTIHDPDSTITLRLLNHTISRIDLNLITMEGQGLSEFYTNYTVELTINEILDKEPANLPLGPPHPTVVGPDFAAVETLAEDMRKRGFKAAADELLTESGYEFAAGEELEKFKDQQLLELEQIKQNLKRKRIE